MSSANIRSVAADSNVLLSAVAGRAARRVFENVDLIVVTTEANLAEVEAIRRNVCCTALRAAVTNSGGTRRLRSTTIVATTGAPQSGTEATRPSTARIDSAANPVYGEGMGVGAGSMSFSTVTSFVARFAQLRENRAASPGHL